MKMMNYLLYGLLFLNCCGLLAQNNSIWTEVEESRINLVGERQIVPEQYRVLSLEVEVLQNILKEAPDRYAEEAQTSQVLIDFPLPEKEAFGHFKVLKVQTMEVGLAEKFPQFETYVGVNVENPAQRIRFDWTDKGLHGMVLYSENGSFFIDPYQTNDLGHYICYYKKDLLKKTGFKCEAHEELHELPIEQKNGNDLKSIIGDCELRSYRLAVAATGEYTTFHGGVASAQGAIVTTINRVNEIYEVDLGINLILVSNNDWIIYSNAATDPYNNADAFGMLSQNQSTINAVIGSNNYDVGHVFATTSDSNGFGVGVAGVGVICNSSFKAYGTSGSPSPVGDPFAVDYAAHEIGHQLGGRHSFNNDCSGSVNPNTAMEPGSGSTILGYAGICTPNVQLFTDPYFHGVSIEEIVTFTNSSSGNNCAQITPTTNTGPTVVAGVDYTIPVATPFELSAIGTDPEGDILTYCWEQMDNEMVSHPPLPTHTSGPAFRSLSPTTLPYRSFPSLDNILDNSNDEWEVLPTTSRTMDFRVTVRDNNISGGCTDYDEMRVTTAASAGPFLVNNPNTNVIWNVGDNQTVTWDVANTNLAPVSCANVDVLLSTDGGLSFPTVLAAGTPNDGSEIISVPNNISTNCRVKIVCSDNIFFDISDTNFAIEANQATFTLSAIGSNNEVCGTGTLSYTVELSSVFGFSSPVTLSASGGLIGASYNFGAMSLTPTNSTSLLISIPGGNAVGTYPITITATGGGITKTEEIEVIVNTSPAQTSLLNPINGEIGISLMPILSWNAVALVTGYTVDIASDPNFTNIVETAITNTNSWTVTASLNPLNTYYWRVFSGNACGLAPSSATFSFETEEPTYCTVGSVNIQSEWINNVTIGSINNTTGSDSGYGDYTNLSTDLEMGGLYAALLSPGFSPNGTWPEYWRIWIDYDRNGDFYGANELVFDAGTTSSTLVIGSISVPEGITTGPTRMRIAMEWVDDTDTDSNGPPEVCEFLGWGEIEDYTVNIVSNCADSDADGVCDEFDDCPGGNDLVDFNNNGIPDDCDLTEVNLKVLLEGGFDDNTGLMKTQLVQQGILPIVQPYSAAPYFYNGIESLTNIPSQTVDWVLVEVRSGPNPSDLLGRKAGLLMSDGAIKDVNGVDGLYFGLPLDGQFYFVIRHRNHLDIMTAIPFERSLKISYDLTVGAGQAFGSQQLKVLSNGQSAMYGGDVNRDLVIQTTDYDEWKAEPAIFGTYEYTDINLDGTVQTTDYDLWFLNKAKVSSPELGY